MSKPSYEYMLTKEHMEDPENLPHYLSATGMVFMDLSTMSDSHMPLDVRRTMARLACLRLLATLDVNVEECKRIDNEGDEVLAALKLRCGQSLN